MASITITTNPAHDARIAAAFGRHLGLTNQSATGAQIRTAIIAWVKTVVQQQERDQALQDLESPSTVDVT